MSERAAGILMPISSLPSEYGIGCFSKSAYEFVDWLKKAGQSYWQILPLGPTSYGDSPYQSFSTFAGNPYFISLEALVEEGVLTKAECEAVDWGKVKGSIDYKKIYEGRYPLLRKAYERSNVHENAAYQQFVKENSWWLSDYALFMAVKDRFDGVEWKLWADDIKLRWGPAMDYYREELYFDIEFHQYMQFKFYEQWMQLKTYANIIDVPLKVIYTMEEFNQAVKDYSQYDLILIDTAGRSHKNSEQCGELYHLLEDCSLDESITKENYLVLSATTKYKDLLRINDVFGQVKDYGLIFTKLDETLCLGNILNLRLYSGAPLSYLADGQSVPDDINTIDPQMIAKSILGQAEEQ